MAKRYDLKAKTIPELAKKIALIEKRDGMLPPWLQDIKKKVDDWQVSYKKHCQHKNELADLKEYCEKLESISIKNNLDPVSKEELIEAIQVIGKQADVPTDIVQSAIDDVVVDYLRQLSLSAKEISNDIKLNFSKESLRQIKKPKGKDK